MALTVEDGTGKSNADAYISAAYADTYFAIRKIDSWKAKSSTEREAAIVRATAALDGWLRGSWVGVKKTSTQALAWPRIAELGGTTGVLDEDGYELSTTAVPTVVSNATAEIALIELSERFIQQEVSRDNTVASETVGPISVSYRADAPTNKRYPHVEAMLRGVANTAGTQVAMNIYLSAEEIEEQAGVDYYDLGDYVIKNY
jgi:hypothetical protein